MVTRQPINHGTPAGAQAHRRRGEDPCTDCKTADTEWRREYQREYRKSPTAKRMARMQQTAYRHAMQALARLHADEYAALYAQALRELKQAQP